MRKIYAIFFLFISMGVQSLSAQTRYLDEVFTNVNVDTSVMYGVNATVLYYSVIGQAVPQPLMMDVYSPAGDVETSRPLMIYLHSGNFLPDNYTTGGTRRDSSVVELCSRFAKMGYVVASCDYRLGWNPLDTSQDGRVTTLINAAYRGVQDCRTAVRYFRKSFQDAGNPYGIDTSRIVVTGQGTGGYIALANATLDTYTDVVLPKFTHIVQTPGGPVTLPMVLESVNGDIDGTTFGTTAGFVAPGTEDTLCYPNHVGYASNVHATMNMGGALGDSSWFDAGDGPFISFQVPSDPYAPYGDGMVIVPGFNLNVVEVSGSLTVQQLAAQFGNNDVFQPMEASSINASFTAGANLHNNGLYGLYPFVRPATQPADSAPWDWWALTDESSATGLMMNPDMSATKGRAFCDTIQHYAAPRLMCALNLPNSPCFASVTDLTNESFNVYPNPNNGTFTVQMSQGLDQIRVMNNVGQVVNTMNAQSAKQFEVAMELPSGLYFVEVTSRGRRITQRFVVH
jgi:hypothetical protein